MLSVALQTPLSPSPPSPPALSWARALRPDETRGQQMRPSADCPGRAKIRSRHQRLEDAWGRDGWLSTAAQEGEQGSRAVRRAGRAKKKKGATREKDRARRRNTIKTRHPSAAASENGCRASCVRLATSSQLLVSCNLSKRGEAWSVCPFSSWALAKISGRHASLDRISLGVVVVCGSLMWRATSTSRQGVKRTA